MTVHLDFEDGPYPTGETLAAIQAWPGDDFAGLMSAVGKAWESRGWLSIEPSSDEVLGKAVTKWSLSTGGWSGNESIIEAMRANFVLWHMHWVSMTRGGHYVFYTPRAEEVAGG